MKRLVTLSVLALFVTACGSSRLGESRAEILRDVDVENITTDREMTFGSGLGSGYKNFGDFAGDKLVSGGEWTPDFGAWSKSLKAREVVWFTTVSQREYNEDERRYEPSAGTVWYFWNEDDRCIAILKEPWD